MTEQEHRPADRVIAALLGPDMLITDEGRERLIEIASRENVITEQVLAKIAAREQVLSAKAAVKMDGTSGVVRREGVAVIDVAGPIMRYADVFSEISGGTSMSTFARDFTVAVSDQSVDAIMLRFDTPGGEVKGVNEGANMILAAREVKPVGAYVETAGSAGYWLASAVTPGFLWIDAVGQAGSIGARVSAMKPRERNSVEAVSAVSPLKVFNPDSETGRAILQQRADELGEIFVAAVSSNRSMTRDETIAPRGQMLTGRAAVTAGLADQVGSFEGLLVALQRAAAGQRQPAAAWRR